jgi:hypothetical protein
VRILLFISGIFAGLILHGQDLVNTELLLVTDYNEYEGWNAGAHMGYYFPSDQSAMFYNGMRPRTTYGSQRTVLEYTIIDQPIHYTQIKSMLNRDFRIYQYPPEMFYGNTFNWGVMLEKSWRNSLGIFFHFNTLTLEASGKGSLQLLEWNGGSTEPILETIILTGKENRFNINLGIQKLTNPEESTTGFIEVGGNLNYALAQENRVHIRNLSYNIFYDYQSNLRIQYGGLGWGVYLGGGWRFKLNDDYFMDAGANVYYQDIVLFENSPWEWSYSIYLRFAAGNLFGLDDN